MTEAFAQPMPPEFHEQAMLSGLLGVLHEHKENALQLQMDQQEAHSRALQPLRAANYVVTFFDEINQIPARHHRIIFGPQYHSPPYEGIERLVVRFPITTEDMYPELQGDVSGEQSSSSPSWNDVFIELITEAGDRQNYLLNGKGLVAFAGAEDVVSDFDCLKTGDLFAVHQPLTEPDVNIDVFTLSYLLNYKPGNPDSYVYHQQTNEIDPPRYY